MITATKQFTFDCAHMLSGHEGACKNLHGHTYQLFVTVVRDSDPLITHGPSDGMVTDFKELKEIINDLIIDKFDHAFVAWRNGNDAERALLTLAKHHLLKVVELDFRPTAENMSLFFGTIIHTALPKGLRVSTIKLYETPTSFAEFNI